jgi:hypothetical protein
MPLNKKSNAFRNLVYTKCAIPLLINNNINNNALFQTIAIGWFFGVNKFAGCVEQMTGFK